VARIRSIKPDYWKSESIARLSWPARLIFIALWSYVDDNGVGLDNDKLIAAEIVPLEEDPVAARETVRECLDELSRESRIRRYEVSGKRFLFIVNWDEHQKIDRPGKPRYPRPPLPPSDGDKPVTCEDVVEAEILDEASRGSRETPSPGEGEQGAGRRGEGEQGEGEQGDDAAHAARATSEPEPTFEEFWRTYPRHDDRKKASAAWEARLKAKADPALILAGARRYRDDPNREDAFTKLATTWLNGECWDNPPLPPRQNDRRKAGRQQMFTAWEENARRADQRRPSPLPQIGA
jgi:hypothetical protein